MAGGMDLGSGGKGGKKPLDTAINLVPFIDLMAVTISFLIMTAVWTQVGRLQVSQAGGESNPTEEQKEDKTVPVNLLITDKELRLTVGQSPFDAIPVTRDATGRIDLTKLEAQIKQVKEQLPPEQNTITLQTEDAVKYDDLVRIIDQMKGQGLGAISISPVTG
jgi:biopolymer transport protein TolR